MLGGCQAHGEGCQCHLILRRLKKHPTHQKLGLLSTGQNKRAGAVENLSLRYTRKVPGPCQKQIEGLLFLD